MMVECVAFRPTVREREEALKRGAQALRARWPKLQADILVNIGPNLVEAHAAWLFAGVILVTVRWSGDLIAQSLPGQPYVLDPSVCTCDAERCVAMA